MAHPTFQAVSISYKTAPLAIREQVALSEAEVKALTLKAQEVFGLEEMLVVSTCNRTEIYVAGKDLDAPGLIRLLAAQKGISPADALAEHFVVMADTPSALRHLFEVAAGLHSGVIGDLQIPHQVKQAYQWAVDANAAGPFLHRLMHTVFFTNKRITQETAFRDGAASVSYAAVELVEDLTAHLPHPRILLAGLGEIGADVARTLADRGFTHVTLTNRTRSKADALAHSLPGFEVAEFELLAEKCRHADVIISSVRMPEPLFTQGFVASLGTLTYQYFIDLSVPRSVDAAVEELPGVLLYGIDDISNKANAALERRLAAVPQVQALIEEALQGFEDWSREMSVSPTIQKFKQALEQMRKEEMARYLKNLTAEEAEKVDKITASLINKILRLPAVQLKAACHRGNADQLADTLAALFDLQQDQATA